MSIEPVWGNEEPDETPVGNWAKLSFVDSMWNGVQTTYHLQDNEMLVEKSYDAEPFLREAAEARAQSAGKRYADMQKIGTVPAAVMSRFMQRGLSGSELTDAMLEWIKVNSLMIHFDPFTKQRPKGGKIILL